MDMERVLDAFRNCISEPKCKDCPWKECEEFDNKKIEIPADLALAVDRMLCYLLKEQEAVVRCKDCKYWSAERINDFNKCRRWINVGVKNFATIGDWFCADGERRTE